MGNLHREHALLVRVPGLELLFGVIDHVFLLEKSFINSYYWRDYCYYAFSRVITGLFRFNVRLDILPD